jgi:hypothetical protein
LNILVIGDVVFLLLLFVEQNLGLELHASDLERRDLRLRSFGVGSL